MDLYFRQKWSDKRLYSSDIEVPVVGGKWLFDKIWTPDTFFSTVSTINSLKYPTPNVFVKIDSNGTVFCSQRFAIICYIHHILTIGITLYLIII